MMSISMHSAKTSFNGFSRDARPDKDNQQWNNFCSGRGIKISYKSNQSVTICHFEFRNLNVDFYGNVLSADLVPITLVVKFEVEFIFKWLAMKRPSSAQYELDM